MVIRPCNARLQESFSSRVALQGIRLRFICSFACIYIFKKIENRPYRPLEMSILHGVQIYALKKSKKLSEKKVFSFRFKMDGSVPSLLRELKFMNKSISISIEKVFLCICFATNEIIVDKWVCLHMADHAPFSPVHAGPHSCGDQFFPQRKVATRRAYERRVQVLF